MPLPFEFRSASAQDVIAAAERLCGERVTGARACGGGGNNRVYRIETPGATYAMKCYGPVDSDKRDRLGHEFDGLRFLSSAGVGSLLPAAIAVDRTARCALYEWIDGVAVADHGEADIAVLLGLLSLLHEARHLDGAVDLQEATEAVLRGNDLTAQIRRRIDRLDTAANDEPDLAAFLSQEVEPEFERWRRQFEGQVASAELAINARTLSPSDLGFHNALRRPNGSLTFLDFEYFGWDDPAKLVADVLWHPAMALTMDGRRAFLSGALRLYGSDTGFESRFNRAFPLYGIRWVLIILNEFVPAIWERRSFSGKGGDWGTAKRGQLLKARAKLAAVRVHAQGVFS